MVKKLFVVAVVIGFCLSNAYGLNVTKDKKADNDSDAIKMVPAQITVLTFEANPTTGYGWTVANQGKSKVVELLSHCYVPNFNTQHFVGSGGVEVWKFKALKKGKESLTFNYVRPWEKGVAPVQTRQVKFVVTPL